jgi:hypothetical protein
MVKGLAKYADRWRHALWGKYVDASLRKLPAVRCQHRSGYSPMTISV